MPKTWNSTKRLKNVCGLLCLSVSNSYLTSHNNAPNSTHSLIEWSIRPDSVVRIRFVNSNPVSYSISMLLSLLCTETLQNPSSTTPKITVSPECAYKTFDPCSKYQMGPLDSQSTALRVPKTRNIANVTNFSTMPSHLLGLMIVSYV